MSNRARGANRGGCGGGYENLDPDWEDKRIKRLRAEYDSLDSRWKQDYLASLNKRDQWYVTHREEK